MTQIVESTLAKRQFTPTSNPDIMLDQFGQQCLDISKLIIPSHRVREDYKDLDVLRDSILEVGLLNPITVQRQDGKFYLAAGGRRTKSFMLTGERYIPIVFKDEDDIWAKKVELIENLIRQPLEWPEQALARKQLDDLMRNKYGAAWNQQKTAALTGESQKTISNMVRLGTRLEKNPELAEQIRHLPMSAALKNLTRSDNSRQAKLDIESGARQIEAAITNCDALTGLATLTPESQHLWLTDPPFGEPAIEMDKSRKTNMIYTGTLQPEDNLDFASYRLLMAQIVPAVARVLIPGAHFYVFFSFAHYEFLLRLLQQNNFIVEEDPLIWYKARTTTSASGYNYPRSYEPLLWGHFREKKRRLSGENLRDVLDCSPVTVNERLHNFQKPQKLLIQLISNSTILGENVLDTFAGSGSTILAAKLLQRNGTGFEVNMHNYLLSQTNLRPLK